MNHFDVGFHETLQLLFGDSAQEIAFAAAGRCLESPRSADARTIRLECASQNSIRHFV